jgi:hypothetical protein
MPDPPLTLHEARDYYQTMVHAAGLTVKESQGYLGHRSGAAPSGVAV